MIVVATGTEAFGQAGSAPVDRLRAAGVQLKLNPTGRRLTEDEVIAHLDGVDGLLAGLEPLTRRVMLSARPRLKVISRIGVGMSNVDQAAARELGIAVANTPDAPTQAVAELTVGALLALLRRIADFNAAMHAGAWEQRLGRGMGGLTILLVGSGRIGRRTAELLAPFGPRLLMYGRSLTPATAPPGVTAVGLDEGLAQADVVSLHASGETPIIGARELALCKPGVLVLNSARGAQLDEAALMAALDAGHVAGGWLDVFVAEPYSGPLAAYPQLLLTPHVGSNTGQCRLAMETQAVDNLLRLLG